MKNSMPITDVEYVLTETDSIVSKTDLNAKITYASDDLVRISGFTRSELIGASHPIMRSPDMPTQVFEGMWSLMKAGYPASAVIKDLCKNGDYYWVLANVAPIYENDTLIGYISVRTKPTAKQVAEADDAYKKIRSGQASKWKIDNGKIVRKTLMGGLPSTGNISIKTRLFMIIAIMALMLFGAGGLGYYGMSKSDQNLRALNKHHILPLAQISQVQKLMLINCLNISASLVSTNPEVMKTNIEQIEKNIVVLNSILHEYLNRPVDTHERVMADKFAGDLNRLLQEGLQPAILALRNHDTALVKQIFEEKLTPFYKLVDTEIQTLSQLELDDAGGEVLINQFRDSRINAISSVLLTIGIFLALWLSFSLLRSIVQPLNSIINHFGQIAQGNCTDIIEFKYLDEVGKVMAALKAMQIKLGYDVEENKRMADENLRIKIALDNVSTGVIVADNDQNIVYVNKSLIEMFSQAESDILKALPTFSAANLVGTNIVSFHKALKHAPPSNSDSSTTSMVNVNLGEYTMGVTINQVIDASGLCIGSVAEWLDCTAEIRVQNEVAVILVGAVMGDFTKRISISGKLGFYRELSESINQLMQTTESGLNEAARVFNVLSHGDLTEKITNHYSGTLGQLKEDANSMVDDLNNIIGQIKTVAESIHSAAREIASGNVSLSDRTELQSASLEQTTVSMQELTLIVQQNSTNAKLASELSVSASDIAGKGVSVINQVVNMMVGINESSSKIVEITSVIDNIAFQTNILALNAAVEAARAGEQGRGFAVVAGEVRSLAQRAASAAGEIKNLIGDSVEKVEDGSRLVTQAGTTMKDIASSIHGVTAIMARISEASVEQTAGIQRVNLAICEMDDVTQQNVALVEQATAAADSMEEQTQQLTMAIAHFKMDD